MDDESSVRESWGEAAFLLLGPTVLSLVAYRLSGLSFEARSRVAFLPGMGVEYVFLVALVIRLRAHGGSLRELGWRTDRLPSDVLVGIACGVALFVLFGMAAALLGTLLPSSTADIRGERDAWLGWTYGVGLVTAFAPIEETLWRGYAIPHLRALTNRGWLAVLLSSLAFASLHWWGGPSLLALTALAGIAYSILFLWRGNLVAVTIAHFVADLPLFFFMVLDIQPPS